MTATTTDAPPRPPAARPAVLQFHTVNDLLGLARILYAGGIAPPNVDRPEKLVPMILAGLEVGLGVMASIECVTPPLNGKCSLYGDAGLALIRASGELIGLTETVAGDGDDRTATCTIHRRGYAARSFTYAMGTAKRLKSYQGQTEKRVGAWYVEPDNMLLWRARWKAMRTEFTDVLRGMGGAEEAEDAIAVDAVPTAALPATPHPVEVAQDTPAPLAIEDRRTVLLTELVRLRALVYASKGQLTPAEKQTVWAEILAAHGAASAKELDDGKLTVLVNELGSQQDPFTYGITAATVIPY